MIKRILALLCLLCLLQIPAAADYDSEITAFPSAWQTKLRALHEKYPEWVFVAVPTGLSFQDVVAAETGKKSLVEKYYSPLLRAHNEGHYNPATGTYTYHDASVWHAASAPIVDYFLNPGNFLSESYIFMFEALSYDEKYHTKEGVELILDGTFMHKTLISYVTDTGERIETEKTYADVIMEAAEASAVSPYYLAAKIRSEIGTTPSGSVTGTYGNYKGIYNFYNIGANDGADPISNGLNWASLGSSYGRPWTTPEKSIINGAVWLGSLYISKGQNTLYFERFNISPDSGYTKYSHQYMTSIYGAAGQALSTYEGYRTGGTLQDAKVFYIPTFSDIPASNTKVVFDGAGQQTGTCTGDGVNIRSGPSTAYEVVGRLTGGNDCTILSGIRTDTTDRIQLLKNPYWYQVQSGSVQGFVCADYIRLNESITLKAGESVSLSPSFSKGSGTLYWENENYTAVEVSADGIVQAKKAGYAVIRAFTSGGGMAAVAVRVLSGQFIDMENHWAKDVVTAVVNRKLFKGTTDNTFSPDTEMTRAMFFTVLGRMYESLGGKISNNAASLPYRDVEKDSWYYDYVAWAHDNAILPYDVSEEFMPEMPIRRSEMIQAMYNFSKYIGADLPDGAGSAAQFSDYKKDKMMQPAADWAVYNKIIRGMGDGTLGLLHTATRAEVAQIMMNAIQVFA
ncbi:MAG: S-layer homology domain-containing protein [Clostridia bacterium]|nr:S-layer homology domain-containing protein [Clostridia bacterium]